MAQNYIGTRDSGSRVPHGFVNTTKCGLFMSGGVSSGLLRDKNVLLKCCACKFRMPSYGPDGAFCPSDFSQSIRKARPLLGWHVNVPVSHDSK